MEHSRIVIYVKDIARILGKSERQARTYMGRMKKATGKERHQFITLKEFCAFTGLSLEEVGKCLR